MRRSAFVRQNFNFSEMSYLCENPLFASYPCVTNPLFDEVSMHSSEGIVEYGCAQTHNDAPLDNGPHESSLLQSSPDGFLESCPVLAICNVLRKQEIYCPKDLIKDISEKPQSMESIENPLFASFPCVTNPLFDSQDVFEKGIVDDVGALEALKLEAHEEERTPYVIAQFPKAMALKENEEAHITAKEIGLNEIENVNKSKLQLHNLVAQPESFSLLNKETDFVSNIRKKLRHTTLNNFFTHHAKEHLKSSAVATVSGDSKGAGYERIQLDTSLKESDNCSSHHNKLNILIAGEYKHNLIIVNNCSQLHLIKHSHVASFDESLGAVGYAVQVKDALGSDPMIYKSLKLLHADLVEHTEFSKQFECGNESAFDHKVNFRTMMPSTGSYLTSLKLQRFNFLTVQNFTQMNSNFDSNICDFDSILNAGFKIDDFVHETEFPNTCFSLYGMEHNIFNVVADCDMMICSPFVENRHFIEQPYYERYFHIFDNIMASKDITQILISNSQHAHGLLHEIISCVLQLDIGNFEHDYLTDSVRWAIPCASRDMVYYTDSCKLPDHL